MPKSKKGEDGKYILRASEAVKKDQSYVLYNFTRTACTYINAFGRI